MRLIFILIVIGLNIQTIDHNTFGQETSNIGLDNSPRLNEKEAEFLNNYFIESLGTFDFKNTKIAFVSGSTGKTYITKREYFDNIKKWNQSNSRIVTSLIVMTDKEKTESGDYDAILTAWVKVLTTKRRINIVKELGSNTN